MLLRIFSVPGSPWFRGHHSFSGCVSFTMGNFGFWFNITLSNICLVTIILSVCISQSLTAWL